MRSELIRQYVRVVEFLGVVLGPDYEVVLHDLSRKEVSIVAIANSHISGRTIGSPATSKSLEFIAKKRYEDNNYEANYNGFSMENKRLRSSTMYIKDENGNLEGLLCINFDDSKYVDITKKIMSLCHPDELIAENNFLTLENILHEDDSEKLERSIHEVAENTIAKILEKKKISADRLRKSEKMQIVSELSQRGIFDLKGAVSEVAKRLHSSEATIYRYLSMGEAKGEE